MRMRVIKAGRRGQALAARDALAGVSGDASGEAALEELLGRIAARWAGLDIPLVPHQGAKDTWVLGALDELTAALEVPP